MGTRAAGLALAAALAACGRGPAEPGQPPALIDGVAKVAQAAAAVTGQEAQFANAAEQGHYVGFDTHTYPGTAVMRTWKKTPGSPYSWVGYYLPSPCHNDRSWTGKRDTLVSMGWGLAAVYVGEQTWGKTPRSLTDAQRNALRAKNDCSADLLSADEGARNADDAASKAAAEGFPKGAVVFLDIEHMDKVPTAMRDYYKAWTARMIAAGRYMPGFYAHEANAQEIFNDVRSVFQAAGDTTTPRMWLAGGKGFDTGRAPQDVGYAFAGVWQGVIDVARSVAKVRLPVDVNVASWKSPSESGL